MILFISLWHRKTNVSLFLTDIVIVKPRTWAPDQGTASILKQLQEEDSIKGIVLLQLIAYSVPLMSFAALTLCKDLKSLSLFYF